MPRVNESLHDSFDILINSSLVIVASPNTIPSIEKLFIKIFSVDYP